MTGENRDKPTRPPGFWGDAEPDEPGPLSLGAWPAPEKPVAGEIESTGPIQLPPQLKAMAARWERPAAPAPRKLKPPTRRFFTPLAEPTFGAPEPQLPSAPLAPADATTPDPAAGTFVLRIPRQAFWACLLGVIVGGLIVMLLDVTRAQRNQPVLLPPKADKPAAVAEPSASSPATKAARPLKTGRHGAAPPRTFAREPNTEFAPQRSITILNAPPKVVVLRPSPPQPEPEPAPDN